jgi:hypothetical protein
MRQERDEEDYKHRVLEQKYEKAKEQVKKLK